MSTAANIAATIAANIAAAQNGDRDASRRLADTGVRAEPFESQALQELEETLRALPCHLRGYREARMDLVRPWQGREGWPEELWAIRLLGGWVARGETSLPEGVRLVEAGIRHRLGQYPTVLRTALEILAEEASEIQRAKGHGPTWWAIELADDPDAVASAIAESHDRTAPGRTYHIKH
jgi:hypothetical protein